MAPLIGIVVTFAGKYLGGHFLKRVGGTAIKTILSSRSYMWIAAAAIIGLLALGAFLAKRHYDNLVDQRDAYMEESSINREKIVQSENNHRATRERFFDYKDESESQVLELRKTLTRLSQAFDVEKENSQKLGKMLAKHDLVYLTMQKPGLIETRMNKGTAKLFRSLEEASGR